MTVTELIEELRSFDGRLPVICYGFEVDDVRLDQEHYFGDNADPNCEIGPAVVIE